VVIYSMATSSADDAPRGLEFLYDLHRLNVATSRARALAIIVSSPDLIRVSCRTPHQMVLANGPGKRAAEATAAGSVSSPRRGRRSRADPRQNPVVHRRRLTLLVGSSIRGGRPLARGACRSSTGPGRCMPRG
jgi:hypothetical protein